MALSKVAYTAAPAQTVFNITFDALSSNHITVFVDGVELTQPTEFTVNSARTQVTLVTPAVGGEYVLLKRATPSAPIVDWIPGGAILDEDLDTLYLQLLYRQQEIEDEQAESIQLTEDGTDVWDAQGKRLTNLADGVDPQDATTVQQVADAMIANGNLPLVTGADNDKMLQVKAGAWVTRTPAQLQPDLNIPANTISDLAALDTRLDDTEADIATLQGEVATLQSEVLALQGQVTELEAGQPVACSMIPNATTLFVTASATWFQNANTRIPLDPFYIERNNSTPHFTKTSDVITIEEPGTYLVRVFLPFRGQDDTGINWRITDAVDGAGVTTRFTGTPIAIGMEANVFPDVTIAAEFLVVVTTTADIVLRARAEAGTTANLTGDGYLCIERFFTP